MFPTPKLIIFKSSPPGYSNANNGNLLYPLISLVESKED